MIRKVLLADDEESVLALVEATLGNDGSIEIYSARDGEQALEIARQITPDVMFLDVMMPKVNGFEVCRALKSDAATRGIKVVMLTGLSQDFGRQKVLAEVGADDYIAKPFSPLELFRKFEAMVGAMGYRAI